MVSTKELEAASKLSKAEIAHRRSISMPVVFQTDDAGNILAKIKTTHSKFYQNKRNFVQVDNPHNVDGLKDKIDMKTKRVIKNANVVEEYQYPAEPVAFQKED